MSGVSGVTIWRRVTPRHLPSGSALPPAGTPVLALAWAIGTSRAVDRVRSRRARLNVKPSPKARDLDRAFVRHVAPPDASQSPNVIAAGRTLAP